MDLHRIRQQLLKDKGELETRLQKIEADMERGRSRDWSEQAQERENDEVLNELSRKSKHQVQRLDSALAKIANDNYGLCEQCHKPIDESRLTALPSAQTCLDCSE